MLPKKTAMAATPGLQQKAKVMINVSKDETTE